MKRLLHYIIAKNQYNIQSPFLYDLYCNVISARMSSSQIEEAGLARSDRFGQLCHKLADHYHALPYDKHYFGMTEHLELNIMTMSDGSIICAAEGIHRSKKSEQEWQAIVKEPKVTLSVDLYDYGIVFTSRKLSKQHFLLR